MLPACIAQGTTIITNMGAANPLAAGHAVLAVAKELQLPRLRVAVVLGDDVLDWVQQPGQLDLPLIDSVDTVRSLDGRLISANAYLGADALLPALASKADVVVTGRVADPSLFLAPLMHHFGWAHDEWPLLGKGLAVGHLLECAAQVSGGYLADPGRMDVPDLHRVGFPLAEVDADGGTVITKLPDTGGRVDRLSCTAQLLYEVEDPAAYLQADVTGDFSQVRLSEPGEHRVRVEGATGRARPAKLKASLGHTDGFIGEGQISYAGPGARARGELALDILRRRLADTALLPFARRLGASSGAHRRQRHARPGARRGPRTLRSACASGGALRHPGPGRTRGPGGRSAVPQRTGGRRRRHAVGARGGRGCLGAGAARGGAVAGRDPGVEHVTTPRRILQDIALARSGDKGNRATLSVIALDPADFPLLERLLTTERVQAHFAGVEGGLQRFVLPQLGAVHFVMHDALAGGVTRSLALDAHGKTLGSALLDLPLPD